MTALQNTDTASPVAPSRGVAASMGLLAFVILLVAFLVATSRVLATILVGLVLGALYLWLKRLAPLVVAHWLIDVLGLGLPILVLAVS